MFWIRFKELCDMVGKSANATAKEMKISSGTITNWKKGTNPQDDNIATVANYFMVSEGYLTGITDVLGTRVAYCVDPNDLPEHVKETIAKNIFLLYSIIIYDLYGQSSPSFIMPQASKSFLR